MLGAAFFSCLSMTIAGIVLKRDRLMGIGQMITMPLFFASNALYPVSVMPGWLQVLSHVNPLSYEVDALRGLLIGTPAHLALDFGVLAVAVVARRHDGVVAGGAAGAIGVGAGLGLAYRSGIDGSLTAAEIRSRVHFGLGRDRTST